MKPKTHKSRRMLIAIVMLLMVAALSTTGSGSADLCRECGLQCANEAWYYMMQCQSNGGSNCSGVYNDYVYNCKTVSCNYGLGCKF